VSEHRAILAALDAGDAGAAEEAIWHHLAQTERALTGVGPPSGPVGG
jgi:DNA-binding FadR family transcriptional regulator